MAPPNFHYQPLYPNDELVFVSRDDEIQAIGRGVADVSLPKSRWTDAAHFAAALWLLTHQDEHDSTEAMPRLIRAYHEATGVANTDSTGYDDTITHASLRAARDSCAKIPTCRCAPRATRCWPRRSGARTGRWTTGRSRCCSPWRRVAAGWIRSLSRCPSRRSSAGPPRSCQCGRRRSAVAGPTVVWCAADHGLPRPAPAGATRA